MGYVRPVPNYGTKWLSSYSAHTRRSPKSSEPGVDYYCPIGTPLLSLGDGVVSIVAGGITPATGRYVKVNLDDGRSFRYLHLARSLKTAGQRVRKGEAIALSGASGYGSEFFGAPTLAQIPANTGGPHVHATLWPTHDMRFGYRADGSPYSLDLELYVDKSATAGGGATPFPPTPVKPKEWDEMATKEEIAQVVAQVVSDAASSNLFPFVVIHGGGAADDPRNGVSWGAPGSLTLMTDEQVAWLNTVTDSAGRKLNTGIRTFATGGNPRAYDHYRMLCEGQPPWVRGGDPSLPLGVADGATLPGIAEAVADEILERLAD